MDLKKLSTPSDIMKGADARYNNEHDASMRLTKTLIRFDGRPYYISDVLGGNWLMAWDLVPHSAHVAIHANDHRLDISNINVGFINLNGNAIYLARAPIRSQKQGFNLNNIVCTDVNSGRMRGKGGLHGDISTWAAIKMSIEGVYPRITELSEVPRGLAISRTWAFGKWSKHQNLWLVYHRQYPVAIYDTKIRRFLFQKGALTRLRYESLNNILAKQGAYDVSYRIEESA